jgi:hypothetical protein
MKIDSLRLIYRINVRFVAAICLLCALAAVGWVSWRLSSRQPRITVNQSTALSAPLPAGEWRQSADPEAAWSEADPFTAPYLDYRLAEQAAARAAEKARSAAKAQHQPKPEAKPAAAPSLVPPGTITLVYRGMLTQIDGSSVAIIEQLENGKTSMMKPGDTLEGFSMAQLDRAAAILTTVDGKTEQALPVGKPIKLTPVKQKLDTQ